MRDEVIKTIGSEKDSIKKGQVSTEQLFVTAIGLTFVGMIYFISMLMSLDTVRQIQAKDAVERIAKTANLVYAMGPDAKISIEITNPDNIKLINISGNRILMRVAMTSGDTDFFAYSNGQLNGSISKTTGIQRITLSVDDYYVVQIRNS
jgi:uncharacterized protein (UPF0333 family)